MAVAGEEMLVEGANVMAQKGCHRSLRRAGGTVFLPLKGS